MTYLDAVGLRFACPLCDRPVGLTPRGRWASHGPRVDRCPASGRRVAEVPSPAHPWNPDPESGQGRRRCSACGARGWRETRSGEVLVLAEDDPRPARAGVGPPPRAAPTARSARRPSLDDYDRGDA